MLLYSLPAGQSYSILHGTEDGLGIAAGGPIFPIRFASHIHGSFLTGYICATVYSRHQEKDIRR